MSRTAALVLAALVLAGCGARRPFDQGVAYLRQGQYVQARAAFDQAIREAPGSAEAYTNRGIAWIAKRAYPQAVADFTQALELDPRHTRARFARGTAHSLAGDLEAARRDWTQ